MENQNKKILLVDDDKFLIDMYSVKFKSAGFEVVPVFSGEEALNKLKEDDSFDVVITDMIMPGMSGMEFLEGVHKGGLAKKSALIVLSNQGQTGDVEEAKKYGIDGYIVKANTIPSEVLEQVVEIMNRKQGRVS